MNKAHQTYTGGECNRVQVMAFLDYLLASENHELVRKPRFFAELLTKVREFDNVMHTGSYSEEDKREWYEKRYAAKFISVSCPMRL